MLVTQERLKQIFKYDEITGLFTKVKSGKVASCIKQGYVSIQIDKRVYKAQVLAYIYKGVEIPEMIDHVNHVRHDNAWNNLESTTKYKNNLNRKLNANNKSGCPGVSWSKNDSKWQAAYQLKGKKYHIGYYDKLEDAIKARKSINKEKGFHRNHGI